MEEEQKIRAIEEYPIRRELRWEDIDLSGAVFNDIPGATEDVQDSIGTILADSTTIDFTYTDNTPEITAAVKNNSLGVGKLTFTATDKLAGRSTASAGEGEEITCTAAGRALLDDATAADQRTTLDVPSNSEAILDTIIAAKGDLIVGTADNTPAILTVGGTNGHVLTIDSGETSGLKWAAAAGGGSGAIAQMVRKTFATVVTTGSTFPADDSIPQIGEGASFFDADAFTPTDANSTILIDVLAFVATNTSGALCTIALFKDSDANALAASKVNDATANVHHSPIAIHYQEAAVSTSARTYKLRYGANAGTTTGNGVNAARLFGGVVASSITITEVLP
jgi:hypothetical protein